MAPSIPDRWIPYNACGRVIEGTRFICFKVPLKKSVQQGNREIKEKWDVQTLLKKIPMLGAVIDLTNTARYYNPQELTTAGILYKKILMQGRIIPPENKVQEFINTIDEFLGKDCAMTLKYYDKDRAIKFTVVDDDFKFRGEYLVGVHCTHGLNRTGYMLCRYMRDKMGMQAGDAIKKFEKARGYKIERDNYIADLLGKEPPPPHFGKHTDLKPFKNKRTPRTRKLTDDDSDRKNSFQFSGRPSGSSWWRDDYQPGSSGKGRMDSDRSFDYKYDY